MYITIVIFDKREEVEAKIGSHYNCYKLFGFDVMFDDNFKPWLIEVNNIPSLFNNTIDSFVNRPMVQVFRIIKCGGGT